MLFSNQEYVAMHTTRYASHWCTSGRTKERYRFDWLYSIIIALLNIIKKWWFTTFWLNFLWGITYNFWAIFYECPAQAIISIDNIIWHQNFTILNLAWASGSFYVPKHINIPVVHFQEQAMVAFNRTIIFAIIIKIIILIGTCS